MAAFGEQEAPYAAVFGDVSKSIDAARESVALSVNAAMTAAHWLTGHRIVEFEQSGEQRAEYGLRSSSSWRQTQRDGSDAASRGRTCSTCDCSTAPNHPISSARRCLADSTPIPSTCGWRAFRSLSAAQSADVRLQSVRNESAREFCEAEALRRVSAAGSAL